MGAVVVVGLGNELLGDDGIGPAVVRALAARGLDKDVELREAAAGGLRLLELLEGFTRAVLIDACESPDAPGTIRVMPLEAAALGLPGACGHGIRLEEAIALGRALGVRLPAEVVCIGVAVGDTHTFRDGLSPDAARAVEAVARKVEEQVEKWLGGEVPSTKPASRPT